VPEDLQITDSRYGTTLSLDRCADCGFLFAEGEELPELVALYEQLTDPGYEGSQEPRRAQMRWLLREVRRLRPQARTLVDIGAGTGLLVAEAAALGLEATGVEPSRSLVEAGRRNGVQLLQGTWPHPELAGRAFDLIFLVDVIEHVCNPLGLLSGCERALAEEGIVVLVTPDVQSVAARLLGRRWWHFRLAHVGYFSGGSMRILADRAGLQVARMFRAKWFFQVSYLADRVARYLPVGGLNRLARRAGPLRRLYNIEVPLNLHDSWVFCLSKK
jgi:SAM-dependent methyltransferase